MILAAGVADRVQVRSVRWGSIGPLINRGSKPDGRGGQLESNPHPDHLLSVRATSVAGCRELGVSKVKVAS